MASLFICRTSSHILYSQLVNNLFCCVCLSGSRNMFWTLLCNPFSSVTYKEICASGTWHITNTGVMNAVDIMTWIHTDKDQKSLIYPWLVRHIVRSLAEQVIVRILLTSVISEWKLCAQLWFILVTVINKPYAQFKKLNWSSNYEIPWAWRIWLAWLNCCHLPYPFQIFGGNMRDGLEILRISLPNPVE